MSNNFIQNNTIKNFKSDKLQIFFISEKQNNIFANLDGSQDLTFWWWKIRISWKIRKILLPVIYKTVVMMHCFRYVQLFWKWWEIQIYWCINGTLDLEIEHCIIKHSGWFAISFPFHIAVCWLWCTFCLLQCVQSTCSTENTLLQQFSLSGLNTLSLWFWKFKLFLCSVFLLSSLCSNSLFSSNYLASVNCWAKCLVFYS